MSNCDGSVDADTIFDLLSNAHRRRLLVRLGRDNPQPAVPRPESLSMTEGEWEDLKLEMHHVHLPKLDAAGLVRWDRDEQLVRTGPAFERVRPLVEFVRENPETLLA